MYLNTFYNVHGNSADKMVREEQTENCLSLNRGDFANDNVILHSFCHGFHSRNFTRSCVYIREDWGI